MSAGAAASGALPLSSPARRLGRLKAGAGVVALAGWSFLICSAQWTVLKTGYPHWRSIPYWFFIGVCRIVGVRVKVLGTPIRDRPAFLVANHTSYLDIFVIGSIQRLSFIAKQEVGRWPVFGAMSKLQKTVFVDRGSRSDARAVRDEIIRRLKSGDTMAVFPEGTSTDGMRVLPFKSALFSSVQIIAQQREEDTRPLEVQPVSITYTRAYGIPMGRARRPFFAWFGAMDFVPHLWEAMTQGPFEAEVRFHAPVTYEDFGNRKGLTEHCEKVVRAGVAASLSGKPFSDNPLESEKAAS